MRLPLEPKQLKCKYKQKCMHLLDLLDLLDLRLLIILSHPFLHQGKCPEAVSVTTV
jgi:hypothetical protein